jgi:endonuclease YncB( thermonuclease family)
MGNPVPFDPRHSRREPRPRKRRLTVSPIMVVLPLAALTAVLLMPSAQGEVPQPDIESARFATCGSGPRVTCVVDGDTFWYRGAKIRIADINTPEVSEPQCAEEARLGAAATRRLAALLNDGPFTLEIIDRDRDRYGRLLRVVTRGGESLGLVLVREGLAEEWRGYRGSWC